MSGKKSERVLMRVTEEMSRKVKARAELNHRPIQDEFRFLITYALEHLSYRDHKDSGEPFCQPRSTSRLERQEKSA